MTVSCFKESHLIFYLILFQPENLVDFHRLFYRVVHIILPRYLYQERNYAREVFVLVIGGIIQDGDEVVLVGVEAGQLAIDYHYIPQVAIPHHP